MAGVKMSTEILNLRRAATSFGYVVKVRNNKIFFVNPDDYEIYIATKRPRPGYYGLNLVDREMWEAMGAEGIIVFQNIITQELIKWLYDKAIENKKKTNSEYTRRSERPVVTISRRIGRNYQKEYAQRLARAEETKKTKKIKRRIRED